MGTDCCSPWKYRFSVIQTVLTPEAPLCIGGLVQRLLVVGSSWRWAEPNWWLDGGGLGPVDDWGQGHVPMRVVEEGRRKNKITCVS
jgi:hypothetical protein